MVELYLHLQMGSTLYEIYERVSKLLILGMVIPPSMTGILIMGTSPTTGNYGEFRHENFAHFLKLSREKQITRTGRTLHVY